jgi:DNA topoisomerase-1
MYGEERMAKNLVIVESASKAATIKKYLGKNYKVVASVGHVRDLPKSQMGIDLENDYQPKYITIRGKGEIIAKLKKEAKGMDKIYLATDPDREGEAIAWHLAYILNIDPDEKARITFNEITKSAIENSLKKPRSIDLDLVNAQQTRRFIDRIVGYSISPILWKKVKKGLSAGRVQSVAVRMICDREKEINDFVQEEYWTLDMKGRVAGTDSVFEAAFYGRDNEKIELSTGEQTDKIIEQLKKSEFTITSVKKGTRSRSPAAPFTTSTLQQDAARKLSFSTKKTMMLAQQLYEGVEIKGLGSTGLITYIRTDSRRISTEAAEAAKQYIAKEYGEKYLPDSPRVYKNKSSAQDAHEAIRPAHLDLPPETVKDSLSRDQYRLYKLIWDRFIASQMANAEYTSELLKYYDGSDLSRIKVQQNFVKELIKQKANIVGFAKISQIVETIFDNVQTNATMSDVLNLAKGLPTISLDKINFFVLPGTAEADSIYYEMNEAKTAEIISEYFYSRGNVSFGEEDPTEQGAG